MAPSLTKNSIISRNIPKLIGRLALLVGVLMIAAVFVPPLRQEADYFFSFIPPAIRGTAAASSLFFGLIIITLARGLTRRKRRARNLAIIILLLNPISSVTISFAEILLIILLVVFRKEFYAKSDPSTKWRPLIAFAQVIILSILSSLILLYLRKDNLLINDPNFNQIITGIFRGFIGLDTNLEFKSAHLEEFTNFFIGSLGFFSIVLPFILFFRRVKPLGVMSEEDRDLLRKLYKHDEFQDSVAYFATRNDKSVVWSKNKKAAIAYRVVDGVMLASGDPIGEYSLWPEAIAEFIKKANEYAWTPAVMGASERGGEVWVKETKMLAFDYGDEAIIDVKSFTIEGKIMGNVRHMVNRTKRDGYSATTCKWIELEDLDKQKLISFANEWRYGATERGFSMSMDRFGDDKDSETIITIARKDDEIKGFIYFMPWSTFGWSLDRMQRERGIDPGINELMIVSTVEEAKQRGITKVSLNFAAFRSVFERADKLSAGPIVRFSRNAIRFASNWFQVESLFRFNAKFQPEWQTRYVLYPTAADIPRVGWAALKAERFISGFKTKSVK